MKIRTDTAADGEDLTIRVYAGNGIAFYTLIVTLARWLASMEDRREAGWQIY